MSAPQLESLYQEIILDHYRAPHHKGLREPFEAQVHHLNPTCGDEITLRLHMDASGERLSSISWEGHGCAISQASASMLSDLVQDLDTAEVHERISAFRDMMRSQGASEGDEDLLGEAVTLSGVSRYVARIKCAMLSWVAVEDALTRV
jgi:nitrogen fixation protein NifU and related proteins